MKRLGIAHSGFSFAPQNLNVQWVGAQKKAWIGDKPGSSITLSVNTGVDAQHNLTTYGGKPVEVQLIHVRSWRRMGIATVRCVKNCRCKDSELQGHWTRKATLTDIFRLEVRASCVPSCPLRRYNLASSHCASALCRLASTRNATSRSQ